MKTITIELDLIKKTLSIHLSVTKMIYNHLQLN